MAGELCLLQYQPETIKGKRDEIARRLTSVSPNIKNGTITRIAATDLEVLFNLYNEIFLENRFGEEFRGKMKFSLSPRLTSSAAKTICPKDIGRMKSEAVEIEIRMGLDFFFRYYDLERDKKVSGIITRNALEALQIVFEHELCHVLEFIYFHHSSCKRARFKTMAFNIFRHTDSYHHLPTPSSIAREKYGFKPGDAVSFQYEDRILMGTIYAITKRAAVMVKDKKGLFIDRRGQRYQKYYVPVGRLKRI